MLLPLVGRKNKPGTNRNVYSSLNTLVLLWIDNESFVCINTRLTVHVPFQSRPVWDAVPKKSFDMDKKKKTLDSIINSEQLYNISNELHFVWESYRVQPVASLGI